MEAAQNQIFQWVESTHDRRCHYVVTPNLDHAVQLQHNAKLREAYRQASLVLADGWPLVVASRWFRKPLPERVAGSDLIPGLMENSRSRGGLRLFLLGGMPGVGELAAKNIAARWPHVDVAGIYSPPLGFERDSGENKRIIAAIGQIRPDLLVVGLGAPKQEIWLCDHFLELPPCVAVAAGATIDFLAGVQTRAPEWIQRISMEWLYRAASDPRRLAGRYVRDALALPGLLWRESRR